MSGPTYHIVGIFDCNPDKVSEWQAGFENAVRIIYKTEQTSCLGYEITQDVNDPNRFVLIETYATEEDVRGHTKMAYFQDLGRQIREKGWLVRPETIIMCNGIAGFADRQRGMMK